MLQGILALLGSYALIFGSIMSSQKLHDNMLSNIIRSPMSFFDTTPLGRILNRFSKDIYVIDEMIPRALRSFLMTFFQCFGTLVVIAVASPWFLIAVIPLLLLYGFIQVSVCLCVCGVCMHVCACECVYSLS